MCYKLKGSSSDSIEKLGIIGYFYTTCNIVIVLIKVVISHLAVEASFEYKNYIREQHDRTRRYGARCQAHDA
jgi:hypothetical protein